MALNTATQVGTWWDPTTNQGYTGPRRKLTDVAADPVTGNPMSQTTGGAASVPVPKLPNATPASSPAAVSGATMTGAGTTPMPGGAASVAGQQPVQPSQPAQQPATGGGGGKPAGAVQPTQAPAVGPDNATSMPIDVFGQALNEMRSKLSANDDLMKQKAALLQQLYDRPLTPDQLKDLTPSQQTAVQSSNRNLIDMEIRLINDTVQGRADTLDKSINYLTTTYQQSIDNAEKQKSDAQTLVYQFVQQYGSNAGAALKALYGQDKLNQLKSMGIDVEQFAQAGIPSISQERYVPTDIGGFNVTIPTGTIASQTNNPLNIKYSDTVSAFGASDSGISATDGGTFSSFATPADGINAGVQLLQQNYGNLTVQQALQQWSNGGYGAEITSLNPDSLVSSLSTQQLQQLITDMAKQESGATVTAADQPIDVNTLRSSPDTVNPATGFTNSQLLQLGGQYALTKSIPYFGMSGSSQKVQNIRTTIAGIGADMATAAGSDLTTLQAEYKANSASISNIAQLRNATIASTATATDNLNLALNQSASVPRTGSPIVNRYGQWILGQELTGDPNLAKFETYIYTASREYAKVTSGASASKQGLTDSATRAADELINAAQTPEQFAAVVQAMQQDMQNVKYGYDASLNQISSPLAQFFGVDPNAGSQFDPSKPVPPDLKKLQAGGAGSMSNQDLLNSIPGL